MIFLLSQKKDSDLESAISGNTQNISNLTDTLDEISQSVTSINEKDSKQDKNILDMEGSIQAISGIVSTNTRNINQLKITVDETIPDVISELRKKDSEQDQKFTDLETAVSEAGKVDDVQVDGVSVLDVDTKIANITGLAKTDAIPDVSNFVPYTGATQNLNMGERFIELGDISSDNATVSPHGFGTYNGLDTYTTITPNRISSDENAAEIQFTKGTGGPIVYQRISVGDPVKDSHAATKQYVDDKISAIPTIDTSEFVPYTGATKTVDLGQNNFKAGAVGAYSPDLSKSAAFTFNAIYAPQDEYLFRKSSSNASIPVGVGAPTKDSHAATKQYVDERLKTTKITSFTISSISPNETYTNSYSASSKILLSNVISYYAVSRVKKLNVTVTMASDGTNVTYFTIFAENISSNTFVNQTIDVYVVTKT